MSYKRGRKAIILKQYLKLSSFLYLTKKERKRELLLLEARLKVIGKKKKDHFVSIASVKENIGNDKQIHNILMPRDALRAGKWFQKSAPWYQSEAQN